ncbi:MAG: hypothetical protein ACLFR1_13145 [Spirochaetia bacterium]
MKIRILLLLFTFYCSISVIPQEILNNEFWIESEPIVPDTEYPLSSDELQMRVLREVQFVYSGMVFGFEFRYVPAHPQRQISEEFEVAPIARISWGDPRLEIRETRQEDRLFYARCVYTISEELMSWRIGWESNAIPDAAGWGAADLSDGWQAKFTAMENGIKEAVRNYLSSRIFNRPREITGAVLFEEPPRVIIREGEYRAQVEIKLRIDDVRPYEIF